MSFVCLWIPPSPTGAVSNDASGGPRAHGGSGITPATTLAAALLAVAPHAVVDARGVIWLDARGLDAAVIAHRALELALQRHDRASRVAAAQTAIAAEVGALYGDVPLVVVPGKTDAAFLAPFPLTVLAPTPHLATALEGIGLVSCEDLARLTADAVEIRFGAEGHALWRLARADDPRRIFAPAPRALPAASLAWEEYVLRNPEQLLFVVNRLVETIGAELRTWGETTRALMLELTLANRSTIRHPIRASRSTANRTVWMRLIRAELDRLQLPDGVVGLSVHVEATDAAGARQGDAFDRGFSTARAVDDALTQLSDDGTAMLVEPAPTGHVLPEQRMTWRVRETNSAAEAAPSWPNAPRLQLQLFPEPQAIHVTVAGHRTHQKPARFRTDGREVELVTAIGPDRVSAGSETGARYAREYFTCLTDNGLLVLLYRDAIENRWYLQGWWD